MNANAVPFVMPAELANASSQLRAEAVSFVPRSKAETHLQGPSAQFAAPMVCLGTDPLPAPAPAKLGISPTIVATAAPAAACTTVAAPALTLPGITRREAAPRPPALNLIDSAVEDFAWSSAASSPVQTPAQDALPTPAASAAMQLLRRHLGPSLANALSPSGKVMPSPSVTTCSPSGYTAAVIDSSPSLTSQRSSLFSNTSAASLQSSLFPAHAIETPSNEAVMQLSQHTAQTFFPSTSTPDLPTPAAAAAMKFIRRHMAQLPQPATAMTVGEAFCSATVKAVACTPPTPKCATPGSLVILAPPGSAAAPAPISVLNIGSQLRPTSDCARTAPSAGAPGTTSNIDSRLRTCRTSPALGYPVDVLIGLPSVPTYPAERFF